MEVKEICFSILIFLAPMLSATSSNAEPEQDLSNLQEVVQVGSALEEVVELLAQLQFRITTNVVRDDAFFDPKGFRVMSPAVFHPDIPDAFFDRCLLQECILLQTTREIPAYISGFDHEYRYLWLFQDDNLEAVFSDHGRWILQK